MTRVTRTTSSTSVATTSPTDVPLRRSPVVRREELRTDDWLKTIPVVVITAWSHAEIDAQVAGADRFVSKPFDPDELSTAVEELLA